MDWRRPEQNQADISPPLVDPAGVRSARSPHPGFSRKTEAIHRLCDYLTAALLFAMVVFSPWAFGTTQDWSIRIMNAGGYALGLVLGVKWALRRIGKLSAPMWGRDGEDSSRRSATIWGTRLLALLTLSVLVYCAISAANARATSLPGEYGLEYHEYIPWLPHSYDSALSWKTFWRGLALACAFWAVRDWLMVKSRSDRLPVPQPGAQEAFRRGYILPSRLRLLLWVVTINGAVLALEGLVQHTVGDGRLLWLVTPRINKSPDAQFGPYAYRSNAAQYFLMAWPMGLALWWALRGKARWTGRHTQAHQNLLPCVFVMALVPLVSLSRAGAIIGCTSLAIALFLIAIAEWRRGRKSAPPMVVVLGLVLVLAGLMEWRQLSHRFTSGTIDSGRAEIWENTWKIAKDYPVFGSGPGTFDTIYQYYRPTAGDPWYSTAHNDWLETLVSFGALGSGLLLAALALILSKWFAAQGIPVHRLFMQFLFLGVANCLVYAIVDFPLQIYSVLFLFILTCSIIASVYRVRAGAR